MSHPSRHIVIGADFGKIRDPSAIVLANHDIPTDTVRVEHLELHEHAPYRVVVRRLAALIRKAIPYVDPAWRRLHGRAMPPPPAITLAVDATGLGEPVVEMLREEPWDAVLVPIVFIGPGRARYDEGTGRWIVPKIDLVHDMLTRGQSDPPRFWCPPEMPMADTLLKQFDLIRGKISVAGKLSYQHEQDADAEDEGGHGDLAVAACLASWAATQCASPGEIRWL